MLPIAGIVTRMSYHHLAIALRHSGIEIPPSGRLKFNKGVKIRPSLKHPCSGIDTATHFPGITPISGVINVSHRSRHGEIMIVRHHPSVPGINRGIDGGIKILSPQLPNNGTTVAHIMERRNVIIDDVVSLNEPVLLAREVDRTIDRRRVVIAINVGRATRCISIRRIRLGISPAGRLGHDRLIDHV